MFALVQWSDSLLMLKREEKRREIKREKRYSDLRSAQWSEMVRISRLKQQEDTQNSKNKNPLFKFKLVLQINKLNKCPTKLQKLKRNPIQKSTLTQSNSNLVFQKIS